MSLSEPSDDESSSSEYAVPAKRICSDTYGTSASPATSSQESTHQESDNEPETPTQLVGSYSTDRQISKGIFNYNDQSPQHNVRLSQSSLSENCSSPIDHNDDFKPGFDDNQNGEGSMRKESVDSFYSKGSTEDDADFGISGDYSAAAKKMMRGMGHKTGKGLGKFEHGRVEPVEAFNQKGRRGLGLKPSVVGEVPTNFKWTPDDSKPTAHEQVLWMPPPSREPLQAYQLDEWLRKGPKKLTIDDETTFVDPQILKGVLESKTIFDSLDDEDLRNARFRSNPYETIGAVKFLNRAAVKMANLDAVFDYMFTKPRKPGGESAVDKKEVLYFADVCAGPGGFSEYVLFRRGWRAKGFGFTLKGQNDFKLSDFYAGTPETFNPYYGVKNDGNIFHPANLQSLKDEVLRHTGDKGVHFLMADGGFSVEGQENIQEILSKQLYLCQCLAALMLVRTGGHFVVKLFDVFTMFSVGLIYIMYRCFETVSIHKPVTSRPANSERYLVCKWKKLGTESAEQHLFSVNSMMWSNRDRDEDVLELVPLSVIQQDAPFYEYIYKSNCLLGDKQIKNLLKIARFSKDKSLKDETQAEIKEQCLKLWCIPNELRKQPEVLRPDDTLSFILSKIQVKPSDASSLITFKTNVLNKAPEYLEIASDLNQFKSVYDWYFMFLSSTKHSQDPMKNSSDLSFFIGCGGRQVYQLDGTKWRNLADLHVVLPAKTLLCGEIVKEYRGEGRKQVHTKALHVIDAIMLGGCDISYLPLFERLNQCALFCTALERPFDQPPALPVRCKRLIPMEQFSNAVNNLEFRSMKSVRKAVTMDISNSVYRNEMFHVVGSVLFIKQIKDPWTTQVSKKSGQKYYFRMGEDKKPQSEYHIKEEARMDTISSYLSRVMWPWEPQANAIFQGDPHRGVTRAELENYIHSHLKK